MVDGKKIETADSGTSTAVTSSSSSASSASSSSKSTKVVQHRLQSPWTFYYDKKIARGADKEKEKKDSSKSALDAFKENLKKLGTFNTLEGFWQHYAHIQTPDELPQNHDIFMFRGEKVPAWESFPNGGCWIIKVRKHNGIIARLWEELLFACIGEIFEEPDVAGVVLSTRIRDDLISVWNADNSINAETRFKIGESLKEILNLDQSTKVEYKDFSGAIKDGSTFRNAKAYVYAAQYAQK